MCAKLDPGGVGGEYIEITQVAQNGAEEGVGQGTLLP
jgi:hypothetical protein